LLLLSQAQNSTPLGEVDTMEAKVLVQEIIEAHGGLALWGSLAVLEAEISAWGFLFTAKRRPTLKRVVVAVARLDLGSDRGSLHPPCRAASNWRLTYRSVSHGLLLSNNSHEVGPSE
jgi:hypothetical protein